MAVEITRLSEHPGRLREVRALLRDYILLPDGWEELGPVPVELPDYFATEFDRFPGSAAPPTGEVLVATQRSVVIGMGEIVPLEGDTCELKRVHVVADHQGSGIGTMLAQALLDEARRLGYVRAVLDVLPGRLRARSVWASAGFEEIVPYRSYPFAMVFMGRPLSNDTDTSNS